MTKIERERLMNVIIKEYFATPEIERSLTQLHKKYGVKRQTIAKYLKQKGFEIVNYQNRLRCDEHIFDVIDTEEKAYWLGFIFADGNISSNGHRLEIALSIKDLEHLKKFKNFLNLETKIRIGQNYGKGGFVCRLSVRNKNIWMQLNNKGCIPKKSLILQFPNEKIFANKTLIYDFIRGYCDGDGCLMFHKYGTKTKTEVTFVGTERFLTELENFLTIKGFIKNKSSKTNVNKAFELKYAGTKARKIARLLYENSNVYLDRKYKIYENFCRYEEESSSNRIKSSKISRSWDANTEVISGITKGSETPQRVEGE